MRKSASGAASFDDTTSPANQMDFIVRRIMNRMATCTLVQVKAVNDATVDVTPMVGQIDGAGNVVPHGTIFQVPFFSLQAGMTAIIMPPLVGDIGACLFCHSDIASVKKNKAPSPPGSRRRFDWADALYLGGFLGATPTQFIRLDADGISVQAAEGKPIALASSDKVSIAAPLGADTEYRVAGVKVVGAQQGAITAPTGGSTTDTQSRTAIGQVIAAMQAHGLIA